MKLPLLYTTTLAIGVILLFFGIQYFTVWCLQYVFLDIDTSLLMAYANLINLIIMVLLLWIINTYNKTQPINLIGNPKFSKNNWIFLLLTLSIFIVISGLFLTSIHYNSQETIEEFFNTNQLIPLAFSAIIIAPIYEELLFRGVVLTLFTNHTKPIKSKFNTNHNNMTNIIGILITSALFSASHLHYDIIGLILIFFFSIFLCMIRIKFDTILFPIIAHSINNSIAFYLYINTSQ